MPPDGERAGDIFLIDSTIHHAVRRNRQPAHLAQPGHHEIGASPQAAVRPWVTSGIALVSAGVIAVAPVSVTPAPTTHVPGVYVPSVQIPAVDLQASIIDILTIPAFRQYVRNQMNDYATWGIGFAEAGANLGRAIGLLPETLVVLTQQLLSLDLQGALTTIETALVGTVVAVGAPILDSIITVRERSLAVQLALQSAVPDAFIGATAAVLGAIDGVLRASIAGGQEVVDAVLTLNLGNIVDAFVSATQGFLGSFVDSGQDIIDGIVFAQQTIAAALATPAPPGGSCRRHGAVADVVAQRRRGGRREHDDGVDGGRHRSGRHRAAVRGRVALGGRVDHRHRRRRRGGSLDGRRRTRRGTRRGNEEEEAAEEEVAESNVDEDDATPLGADDDLESGDDDAHIPDAVHNTEPPQSDDEDRGMG